MLMLAGCGRSPADASSIGANPGVGAVDVWIDAGHGGRDPGNLGAARSRIVQEKHLVLAVAKRFHDALRTQGFEALLVRDDDRFLTLGQRSRIANGEIPNADGRQARARLFVSLHMNGSLPEVVGTETFWSRAKSLAANAVAWRADSAAAAGVHAGVAMALGEIYGGCSADRSVREQGYSVLRRAEAPAVLVEMGFVTNRCQQSAMAGASGQRHMAEALARGVRYVLAPAPLRSPSIPEPFELPARPPAENGRGPVLHADDPPRNALDERFGGAAFPPHGWRLASLGEDSTSRWRVTRDPSMGRGAPAVAMADGQRRGADSWLVSPELELGGNGGTLEFRWSGNRRTTAAVLAECRVQRTGEAGWERIWSLRSETPGPEFDWRRERVDLGAWGKSRVRVAFRVAGGRGSDFLLSEVRVSTASHSPTR